MEPTAPSQLEQTWDRESCPPLESLVSDELEHEFADPSNLTARIIIVDEGEFTRAIE